MRISDWSSDLCSSDLYCIRISVLACVRRGARAHQRLNRRFEDQLHRVLLLRPRHHQRLRVRLERARHFAQQHFEIGRYARVLIEMDDDQTRSEEHTSELQSLMRISYAVFCLKKKKTKTTKCTKYEVQDNKKTTDNK